VPQHKQKLINEKNEPFPLPTHVEPNNHFIQFRRAGEVENKRKEGKKERKKQ